jgi:2-hydroxy-4-carboxymuconate semialdehyde hemiacetal dehydrogenase
VNIGLLGYGSIAREHVLAIQRIALANSAWQLHLSGVMGRLAEPTRAFAAEFGMSLATTDLDELLVDPRVDAVIVCSPTDVHAEQTERALRAGKHVLCEIPLATSLADTDRLIALAAASDLRLMVCHSQRYTLPLIEARRMIVAGEVHPYAIVARYLLDKRDNVSWTGRRRSWTDNLLWHHAGHAVDATLWLLDDEAVDVAAQATPADSRLNIPMDLSLLLRTTRQQLVTVAMSYRALPPLLDYVVIAEETSLVCANNELHNHRGLLVPSQGDPLFADGAIDRQDADFFSWIATGAEAAASATQVRPAMAALQAAQNELDRQGMTRSTGAV